METKVTSTPEASSQTTQTAEEVSQIAPMSEPLTGGDLGDYLSGFEFSDINKVTFSDENKVTKTSAVNIKYKFKFDNALDIQKDAEFTLQIPDAFELGEAFASYMKFDAAGVDAVWRIDTDGILRVKFNAMPSVSNVEGWIIISTVVDETKINGNDIIFDLGELPGDNSFPT
jgi:hypothetical protein